MDTPRYVFGAQGFGVAWTVDNVDHLMKSLAEAGIHQFDTAALYPATNPGESEELLGKKKPENAVIDTKILFIGDDSLSFNNMGASIEASLERLQIKQIHTIYAHAPDRKTPIPLQAAYFDHYYRKGYFQRLGLSNYSPSAIRAWMEIAVEENFIMPSVYQGQYNVFCRGYEDELFPVLREFGIAFEATSPLAGGFLTGKLSYCPSPEELEGTRFEVGEGNMLGAVYRMWYDQPVYHQAMRRLDKIGKRLGTTGAQCALRWLLFHSNLKDPDRIVIGPSTLNQLQDYVDAQKAGPLPADAAAEINALWPALKEVAATIIEKGWWSL
ncbi:hypothetical protein CBS147339_5383 [Penicillium roqueforti]|uniref:Aldo/keto reductase n=1 Tax=Penicillium roqueforti (strain FM164) TaxID=1365484 RepID=W6PT83_PENRF|nr:hypothetical protein CBS147354_3796 [Penicillium roqueforti]CDM27403.1 Aldo/keto reductase [Penicillium roqueforti FM164]KAI3075669.1 hypothetical protein CBS147339_5383 [Penicillium roqueforti]KAI3091127.1 hypothetical protein CBS147338_8544 [Penicillium roqueforti]KAI3141181.1 hypothetical protein CBS147325_6015 [Penicillium roqueforti]